MPKMRQLQLFPNKRRQDLKMNQNQHINQLLKMKPSGFDPNVEIHNETEQGLKYSPRQKWEQQEHIDERQVLPNEIVIDIDAETTERARKENRKVLTWLEGEGLPFFVADTGGTGFHIHIFFEVPKNTEDIQTWKEYLYNWIKKEAEENLNVDTDLWDDGVNHSSKHLIRAVGGRKTTTGQRKTVVTPTSLEKQEIENKDKVEYPHINAQDFWKISNFSGGDLDLTWSEIREEVEQLQEKKEERREKQLESDFEAEDDGLQACREVPAHEVMKAFFDIDVSRGDHLYCPIHDSSGEGHEEAYITDGSEKKFGPGVYRCYGDGCLTEKDKDRDNTSHVHNAIDLLVEGKNMEFQEAKEALAEEFDIEIDDDIPEASDEDDPIKPDSDRNPLDRDNLPFKTEHLPGFKFVERGLRLQGEEYEPIRKMCWYQAHSMVMQRQKAELGDVITDCRIHLANPMPSGSGKKNVITFLEKVARNRGREVAKPTSLHPEQLIGKTIRRGKKDPNFEEIKGHLADDLVLVDEAIDLFKSSKEKISQTRSYMNEALDYYGQNQITKRMTDIPKEHRLTYQPHCNMTIFMQPFQVDEEFALQGTLRRYLIPYSDFDPDIQIDGYKKRIQGGRDMQIETALSELEDQLQRVQSNRESLSSNYVQVEDSAVETFAELHRQLVFQGFAHSDKGKNFTRITDYQLQDHLLKFSAIQAIVNGHAQITSEDIEKAYIDLADLLACMLEYIYKKIIGTMDYNNDWKGARKEDRKCLKWLKQQNATSKNKSSITISEYKAKVKEICDIGKRQARRKVQDQSDNGWISKKQIGQHDSRVWLEVDTEDGQGGQDGHGVRTIRQKIEEENRYFELVNTVETDGHPDHPGHPEAENQKTDQESKDDEPFRPKRDLVMAFDELDAIGKRDGIKTKYDKIEEASGLDPGEFDKVFDKMESNGLIHEQKPGEYVLDKKQKPDNLVNG